MRRIKKKKKLNIKRTFVLILFLYILGYLVYFILKQPIKHIEITGNNLLTDKEIIEISDLKNYPSIFKYSSHNIENKIKKLDLVDKVDVKKWFGFVLKIKIKENKILFYYQSNSKVVLSNGDILSNNYNNLYGIPTLTTKLKSKLLISFINNFKKISDNILYEINEIEYFPDYNETNELIDDDRFKITMNDGNTIITNSVACDILNKYNDIYASLNDKKGTLYLDNSNISNLVFIPYGG